MNVDDVLPVPLVLLELLPEPDEELLDPSTVMGSRMVDNALLMVLINAQAVRAEVGSGPDRGSWPAVSPAGG